MNCCYVHIGAPKTGTSAIQNMLYSNRDKLLSAGYVYPDYGIHISKDGVTDGNSRLLLRAINNNDEIEAEHINRRLRRALCDYNVILSAEDLFNRAFINGFDIINKIFSGVNVKVVLFVRNQAEIVQSAIKQRIKNHGKTDYDIPREYFKRFDWFECARIWEEQFGFENILVSAYKSAEFGFKVEGKFLEMIGLSGLVEDLSVKGNRANKSLSGCLLESIRLLNNLSLPREQHERIKWMLIEHDKHAKTNNFGWSLSDSQLKHIKERFALSNQAFFSKYSVAIPDEGFDVNEDWEAIRLDLNNWLMEFVRRTIS